MCGYNILFLTTEKTFNGLQKNENFQNFFSFFCVKNHLFAYRTTYFVDKHRQNSANFNYYLKYVCKNIIQNYLAQTKIQKSLLSRNDSFSKVSLQLESVKQNFTSKFHVRREAKKRKTYFYLQIVQYRQGSQTQLKNFLEVSSRHFFG